MLIPLGSPEALDARRTGGKGSTLARLAARGFAVPGGFVVPAAALARLLDALGLTTDVARLAGLPPDDDSAADLAESIRERILAARLPGELDAAVHAAVEEEERHDGHGLTWAVRSSALAEDLREASFAGQYDTLLGLQAGGVGQGILSCWASVFGRRALGYRHDRGPDDYRAAVVVQRLIEADVAGVCFTVDPASGDERRVVINASYGLGEAVAGGLVTPDLFAVDRQSQGVVARQVGEKALMVVPAGGGVKTVPVPETLRRQPCLGDEQAEAVARLALLVEAAEGHAVDIEWALSGQQLYLLQSRPITAVGPGAGEGSSRAALPPPDWAPETNTAIDPRFPLYSNGNIGEVLPGCVTPLTWDHTGRIIERAFRKQLVELGAIEEGGPEWRVMGFFYHRPYICVSFLAAAAATIPLMTPDTIHEEFVGAKPATATPPFTAVDLLPHRWPVWLRSLRAVIGKSRSLPRAVAACAGVTRAEIAAYAPEALVAWSDSRLLEAVRCTDELVEPSAVHTWTSTFAVVGFSLLRSLTRAWLGDDDGSLASQLATGIEQLAGAPAPAIYGLAKMVEASPRLAACVRPGRSDADVLQAMLADEAGEPFRRSLEAFLERFGHRAVSEAEFSRPCWREDPSQVVALIRNYLQPGTASPDEIRQRQRLAYQAARARLGALGPVRRRLLLMLTDRVRTYIAQREQMKEASILRADRSRRVYAELRRRLLERNLLRRPEDIYFLVWEEIAALTTGRLAADGAAAISERRRADFRRCQRLAVPKLQKGRPRFFTAGERAEGDLLRGMGVSPGRVEGRARVILDPRLGAHIEPGEILVAPVTDLGWTPLFLDAAGLVVEVGGLLSHGSVVAREYGLPAVVGVAGATQAIRSGDRILLDGSAGVVVRLD